MTAMATPTPPSRPAPEPASRRGLGGEVIPVGEDRLLTLPNVITVVRLLCIPVFLWLLFGADPPDRIAAAVLLAVLGATDWVDGYVARHFHQVSNLGKMLDPIVDRALLVFGVGGIIIDGSVPLWFGLFVVVREVVLSTWVISITALGARRMDVTWFGKAQTFAMMSAFPLFLASEDPALSERAADVVRTLAWVCAVPGLVFSVIAFVGYFPEGLRALREGREQRAVEAEGASSGPAARD